LRHHARTSIKRLVRCPDASELDAVALGRGDAATRASVEAHVDGCATCSATVAQLVQLYASEVATAGLSLSTPSTAVAATGATSAAIGRYRLLHRLGEGGMGVVYAAHDPELDRPVAVKVLHPDPLADPEIRKQRIVREAQTMARLAHPNVVTVYDVGLDAPTGRLFVAMELVDGATLGRWVREQRRDERAILDVFLQAGRGLAAAHAAGIVHRDFKPDNVLVGRDGRVRVTDFGLARVMRAAPTDGGLGPRNAASNAPNAQLTRAGALVGTPAYMAPEQLGGTEADARADQFAFAVSLFEALHGARPFGGTSLRELRESVLRGQLPAAIDRGPRFLGAFFRRALAVDPARRYPSMDAALEALSKNGGRARIVALALVTAIVLGGSLALGLRFVPAPANAEGTGVDAPAASVRADVDAMRAELAVVDKELLGWEPKAPYAHATALVARARTVGYEPLLAECLLRLSRAELKVERPKRAREALEEVARLARATRYDALLLDATIDQVRVVGVDLADAREVETWIGFARAELSRSGDDTRRARLDVAIGQVRRRAGKLDESRVALEEAVALRRGGRDGSMALSEALGELAQTLLLLGDQEHQLAPAREAFDLVRADAVEGAIEGRPFAERALGLAEALIANAEPPKAFDILTLASGALDRSNQRGSSLWLRVLDEKAHASLLRGDLPAARVAARNALSGLLVTTENDALLAFDVDDEARTAGAIDFATRVRSKVNKPDDALSLREANALACARAVEGDEVEAARLLEQALAHADDNPAAAIGARGAILANRALLALRRGDLATASASVEDALAQLEREVTGDHLRVGVTRLLRARVLDKLGSDRASLEANRATLLLQKRLLPDDPLLKQAREAIR
jgi:predicted Ser/Thr protein kinase